MHSPRAESIPLLPNGRKALLPPSTQSRSLVAGDDERPLAIAPQLEKTLEAADLHPRQGRTPGPVAITTYHEPSFVFLTGRDTDLTDAEGAARALAEGRPAIVEGRDADAFRDAAGRLGVSGRAVGVVRGYNYSGGDEMTLTVYAPPPRPGTGDDAGDGVGDGVGEAP